MAFIELTKNLLVDLSTFINREPIPEAGDSIEFGVLGKFYKDYQSVYNDFTAAFKCLCVTEMTTETRSEFEKELSLFPPKSPNLRKIELEKVQKHLSDALRVKVEPFYKGLKGAVLAKCYDKQAVVKQRSLVILKNLISQNPDVMLKDQQVIAILKVSMQDCSAICREAAHDILYKNLEDLVNEAFVEIVM